MRVSLARHYRPKSFSDIVGQDVVARILQSGLHSGDIGQVFLFHGTHGIGKTTFARLLARVLNCHALNLENPVKITGDALIEPCQKCKSCIAMDNNNHLDVVEIDAASHTGVENVRNITESLGYQPSMGKFKILIMDEAHMLSSSAFQALLKTLEEPPRHCKFIFASTEIGKIPKTILSRCMRFDLQKFGAVDIQGRLASICEDNNISADQKALLIISESANGSMRDAISAMEQVILLGDGSVGIEDTLRLLNKVSESSLLDLMNATFDGDVSKAMDAAREMLLSYPATIILSSIMELLHRQACGSGKGETKTTTSLSRILHAWSMSVKAFADMKIGISNQAVLEMFLVRIAYMHKLPPVEDILRGITSHTSSDNTYSQKSDKPPATPSSARIEDSKPKIVEPEKPKAITKEDIIALMEKKEALALAGYLKTADVHEWRNGFAEVSLPEQICKKIQDFLLSETDLKWDFVSRGAKISEKSGSQNDGEVTQKLRKLFPEMEVVKKK